MTRTYFRTILSLAPGLFLSCLAAGQTLPGAAPAAAPNVTYTATGTFSKTPVSGSDMFRLAGQPFSISIVANEGLVSQNHGAQWAIYSGLKMMGAVQTALLPIPVTISNFSTNIALAYGNPSYDLFQLGSPVKIAGMKVTIMANITMPKGTIVNDHVLPFTARVPLSPANATVTYSDGTTATTFTVNNGTLSTAVAPAAARASVYLHTAGAQVITIHPDGTQTIRSLSAAPVDTGSVEDVVMLQFYASGVRDAADVRAQIAGIDVPVLYAGAAGHFPGLDQVTIQLPRGLAGQGDLEVVLTLDGRTAGTQHIRVQ